MKVFGVRLLLKIAAAQGKGGWLGFPSFGWVEGVVVAVHTLPRGQAVGYIQYCNFIIRFPSIR